MARVTISLLLKNAEPFLIETLDAIFQQQQKGSFEVLAIDSGSRDATLDILKEYLVQVINISPKEFNHGATRNLAVENAHPDSEFIVFISQDAKPRDKYWLANLLAPLESDDRVAGTFSRHIPRPGASPSLVRQLTTRWQTGGDKRLVKEMPQSSEEYEANKFHYIYFSNTSSAIRRDVLEEIPFQPVNFAEDAEWADRVLRAGYKLVFEPSSVVIHSHDYSTIEQFRQNVDHTHAMVVLFDPPIYHDRWLWLKLMMSIPREVWWDWRFQFSSGFHKSASRLQCIKWLIGSPFWHLASIFGGYVGANLERIPERWRIVFTRQERIRLDKEIV
jgi:GT2 family glycosyltransferase